MDTQTGHYCCGWEKTCRRWSAHPSTDKHSSTQLQKRKKGSPLQLDTCNDVNLDSQRAMSTYGSHFSGTGLSSSLQPFISPCWFQFYSLLLAVCPGVGCFRHGHQQGWLEFVHGSGDMRFIIILASSFSFLSLFFVQSDDLCLFFFFQKQWD